MSKATPIYDITPFTLLDYPDKTACIIWFAGCNMRCGYCYNPDIVLGKGEIFIAEALQFLRNRKGLLDGVVMSGGECTLHPSLIDLALEVKALGMKVKIDTNGSRPEVLKKLYKNDTLDYVALDFKATAEKFQSITKSNLFTPFEQSLSFLVEHKVPFEVRTTVHSAQLKAEDILSMRNYLVQRAYRGNYYLQHFTNNSEILEVMSDSNITEFDKEFSSPEVKVQMRKTI
ncbi:anaerobic ribonucleoside-triphosphate reductase activating protein [Marivirga harenae]|uniref:anaerobic ribonucleoside-triphosphate reductase activating protein n=1 Tax=Marivirga harenae TaxID=2010992 RepID=UPI0026E0A4EC|nr:anaerobic ribonucleoside-triphosphate reductase activating protein [Marivirga harenae]WKV12958.1 anaerobic ribonucleoside-triphosphate reductase activating protein [Marivirga harenae]|tara:strand:- start:74976 stop:75665 length:690 start_codon:yes stop_codon:yes gene_type:complete